MASQIMPMCDRTGMLARPSFHFFTFDQDALSNQTRCVSLKESIHEFLVLTSPGKVCESGSLHEYVHVVSIIH